MLSQINVGIYKNKIWLSQIKMWVKLNEHMNGIWDNVIKYRRYDRRKRAQYWLRNKWISGIQDDTIK